LLQLTPAAAGALAGGLQANVGELAWATLVCADDGTRRNAGGGLPVPKAVLAAFWDLVERNVCCLWRTRPPTGGDPGRAEVWVFELVPVSTTPPPPSAAPEAAPPPSRPRVLPFSDGLRRSVLAVKRARDLRGTCTVPRATFNTPLGLGAHGVRAPNTTAVYVSISDWPRPRRRRERR